MRTAPDSLVGRHAPHATVVFEVDHVDYGYHRGCSVVARGDTDIVEDPAELAHIHSVWEPRPWAAGDRSLVVRLHWTELSGRQLGQGWDPVAGLPVSRSL